MKIDTVLPGLVIQLLIIFFNYRLLINLKLRVLKILAYSLSILITERKS